jgi:AcrR family transcriptional regulator
LVCYIIEGASIATKEKIVSAAQESFSKKGFDLTGVAEICEKAGISKGAFYYHFKSKDDLILYVLERWLATIDIQLRLSTGDGNDIRSFFSNILVISERVFRRSSSQLPVFLDLWIRSTREKGLNKKTIAYYRKYIGFFEKLVEKAKNDGIIKDVKSSSLSKMIISLVIGLLMQGLLDPKGSDWEEVTEDTIGVLFKGILK